MMDTHTTLTELEGLIGSIGNVAVAISGGVDSVTLAAIAHRALGAQFTAFHATSPAVPPQATARVRAHAKSLGWRLEVVDAGEFDDAEYVANPHNRCYFCKKNLYQRIAENTTMQVLSGANKDDLGDYRPGLDAARERQVRHPYVEVGAGKVEVRALAATLGLSDVQDLPAMPCLSSRVESGIAINVMDLGFINDVEERLRHEPGAETVRCRIVRDGVRIELDADALAVVSSAQCSAVRESIHELCASSGRVFAGFTLYQRGSAFLVPDVA
jgi:pyridinium-3,5-biscarboxylic acid mononucleotide sulfurtransferase